ncbi:MAG: ornithine carbamoyltransferase [Candidatus Aquicultor sp.]|nr:ornithine carbamoyltransferase [Candidatus Aquicultor sp.]
MASLKGRNILSLKNYSQDEIYGLLAKAMELKRQLKSGLPHRYLESKTIAMIFHKPSSRTRVSFEVATSHLGVHPIFMRDEEIQLGVREPIGDMGRVLEGYVDAVVIRTFAQSDVEELAAKTEIPVINALTDAYHPMQSLADLMTILELKDRLTGLKLAYIGDGNNVAHSLLVVAGKLGINMTIACPKGYEPDAEVVDFARAQIRNLNHKITVTDDPFEAADDADVIYTDVWASMGQEAEREERIKTFRPYQVNSEIMAEAKPTAIFMHCLPAHRGEEVTDEVIESAQSVVFQQSENRLHTAKAALVSIIK